MVTKTHIARLAERIDRLPGCLGGKPVVLETRDGPIHTTERDLIAALKQVDGVSITRIRAEFDARSDHIDVAGAETSVALFIGAIASIHSAGANTALLFTSRDQSTGPFNPNQPGDDAGPRGV